jgi:hypothetical protein
MAPAWMPGKGLTAGMLYWPVARVLKFCEGNTAQNSAKQAGFCSCKTSISAILGGQGKRHPPGDKVPKEGKETKITNTVSPR